MVTAHKGGNNGATKICYVWETLEMPLFNFEIAFEIVLNFLSKSNAAPYQDRICNISYKTVFPDITLSTQAYAKLL